MNKYQSFTELLSHCEAHQCSIADAALQYEIAYSGRSEEEVLAGMEVILQQMHDTIESGLLSEEKSMSGLSGGDSKRIYEFTKSEQCFLGPMEMRILSYAVATLEENSRMKKIVACPTAGGSGVVPSVLVALEHEKQVPRTQTLKGLLAAGCIGELVSCRMRLSGSAAGCQAEVGVAAGMAAGGIVEAMGGTPAQALHATALALQNMMGLVCDPVAGLVEVPCVLRNGIAGVQAASAATMGLAGVKSFVPVDEVVTAMALVGQMMSPRLKETAEGGLAQTPTAQVFTEKFMAKKPAE